MHAGLPQGSDMRRMRPPCVAFETVRVTALYRYHVEAIKKRKAGQLTKR
jgi:hypothetical protein